MTIPELIQQLEDLKSQYPGTWDRVELVIDVAPVEDEEDEETDFRPVDGIRVHGYPSDMPTDPAYTVELTW